MEKQRAPGLGATRCSLVIMSDAELYVEERTDIDASRGPSGSSKSAMAAAVHRRRPGRAEHPLDEAAAPRGRRCGNIGNEPSELQADLIRAFLAGRHSGSH